MSLHAESLGFFTPEETLSRSNTLNNNFQLLWRGASPAQRKQLDPVMAGWVTYYNRLRDSWVARTTEYGELEGWEAKYQQLKDKFKVASPDVVPGRAAGSVQVSASEEQLKKVDEVIAQKLKETEKASTNLITYALLGTAGLGILFWFLRK